MSDTTPKVDRDAVLRESYQAATKRLREAHLSEWNTFRVEEAKARGVEWTPPPTPEQKASAELDALLAANPHLLEELASKVKPTS